MPPNLFKIRDHGKFGFIDAHGAVVIEPQYFEADDFYAGFSRVRLNNRLVPMDALGRLLLRHFSTTSAFSRKAWPAPNWCGAGATSTRRATSPSECSSKTRAISAKAWPR
ncbi:MAG: WG repeat-containing protein [Saprospirales bacterium]|nr:WG repeat-containing protein [Saprospirales bacterium]